MQRVVLVDYGSGNLHSARKAIERAAREAAVEAQISISAKPEDLLTATRIVLPGVGAFAECRRGLDAVPGLAGALQEAVAGLGRPILGICVGAQLMATRGLEFGETPGLDWIPGDIRAIEPADSRIKIPHMGWNTLNLVTAHPLLAGVPLGPSGLHAYFVHSFQFEARDRSHVVAETDYGGPVTAMVAKDNIAGTQFHPEKSQTLGLKLLANFLRWSP